MKKVLLAMMAVFFLSSCNDYIEQAVDMFEEAAEDAKKAKSRRELENIERALEFKFEE